MDRPYKTILILTFFATITLMGLLATQSERAPLSLLFLGLVTFTILSASYGIFYYFLQKRESYYKQTLIFSAGLTAILFAMDYMVWDKNPPNPSARQIIFESAVIGTIYTAFFFGLFSALTFFTRKAYVFIQKSFISGKGNSCS